MTPLSPSRSPGHLISELGGGLVPPRLLNEEDQMAKKILRRDFLRLSAMAGAGAALSACSPPATPTPAPPAVPPTPTPEPVDLRFVWWGGQTRADITTQVIKMFEAKHPNVKFTYEFLGFNEYWTKVTTQAAGGGLPDIMQTGSTQLVEWTRKGLHVALDEYIKSGVLDFTNIPKVLQDHGAVDGKIYAVSAGSNAIGFALDLDAFAKAGVEVPPDTWTWDDFEKTAITLHEKLGIWGFGHYLHHWDLWRTIYLSYETQLYSADGKSLGYTDDQPGIDHMKMILRLQDAKAIPTLAEEAEIIPKGPEAQFSVTKKCAIDWLAGSNMLVAMWQAAGADRHYKILPIPRPKGKKQGTSIRPSQFQALTSHSKHPKEAAMFLDYFINDVEANKVLNAERGVPINTVVLKALAENAGPAQKAVYDYLDRLAKDSAPLYPLDPTGAETVRTNVYYPEFTDPVRYGKITPEEGVALFRKKANETLAAAK
jgi:multiple sugar transport system substrate-binding protein